MADHATVEYATATGNDYPVHENTYERFVQFTFVGIVHVVNLLLGLATGGVLGHWLWALAIFIVAVFGAIPGFVSGTRTSSYIAIVLCLLMFAYNALGA